MYRLRLLFLLGFALLWATPVALSAQTNYPPLVGSVADGTGMLNVPDVQAAADRLSQTTGATAIALAIANKQGLEIDPYVDGFLNDHGYGSRANKTLNPSVIALVIDFEAGKIYTWYGDSYIQALNLSIQTIQTDLVPVVERDPTDGFVTGFDKIGAAVFAFRNPPPAPVVNQTVDTTGVGNSLLTIFIYVLVAAGVGGGGWLFVTKGLPLLKSQTSLTSQATKLRQNVTSLLGDLFMRYAEEPERHQSLGFVLLGVDPTEADQLKGRYRQNKEQLVPLQERVEKLDRLPVDASVGQDNLSKLIAQYREVQEELLQIKSWIDAIDQRSNQPATGVAAH